MRTVSSSTMERMAVLKDAGLLKGLPFEHLVLLARACTVERYGPGQVVFQEGARPDALYVVMEGRAQVYREGGGRTVVLGEPGRSGVFGEMAIFDEHPRAASVRVLEPTVLLRLSKDDFRDFVINHPNVAMECVRLLSERVREMNDRVQQMAAAHGGAGAVPQITPFAPGAAWAPKGTPGGEGRP